MSERLAKKSSGALPLRRVSRPVIHKKKIINIPRCGIATRNVFLDTEVYQRFGYNLEGGPMAAFQDYLEEGRFVLHVTDITLAEVGRQLQDGATKLANEVNATSRQLERWRQRAPKSVGVEIKTIDASAIGEASYNGFQSTLLERWKAIHHQASSFAAQKIFAKYFQRKPPFTEHKSKEFPDAFVIAELEAWCVKEGVTMYVVTADEAMRNAAQETEVLIPIKSLDELLESAVSGDSPEVVKLVNDIINEKSVAQQIGDRISKNISEINIVYEGELMDGEAYGASVAGIPIVDDFSVLSSSPEKIELIVTAVVPFIVEVQYEDLSEAMWDSEDGIYIGGITAETEVEVEPSLRLFVTLAPDTRKVRDVQFVKQDIHVSEPFETYK